ncbi:hypothetical protein RGUI_0842 [Rhodovulum sp. P5]|uniref:phage tail tube protein n=1 Tax=Rhodovulum sp. P5 TaxID=1564506 RepID=UPI00080AA00C|nr:phage tail tube protein [Rhodovulum sp. P5]YP_009285929.1 hypothetical protein BI026_gp44 [Rhodovulum phage vB_RhkS_P1]ANT39915.1 hypothetical protein Rhks_44 [Rhodovulum phage vB_RhkS_P1]ARE38983.1 hypothetical protein RGUI_0842 [Rhodovulum sp. P5]
MATWQQRLIREKIETVPGSPEVTAATDAVLGLDVTMRNLEADYQDPGFLTGREGAQAEDRRNVHAGIDYQVEAAPSGTAGVAPAFGHLLRSGGWVEAVTADTDVTYTPAPVDTALPSCTLQMRNGALMQTVAGVRGSVGFTAEAGAKPVFSFSRRGRYAAPVAHAAETHAFAGWPRALDCVPENVFAFTLGGIALPVRSFSFTDGRAVQVNKYMGPDEITLGPRRFTGAIALKWPAVGTKDLLGEIHDGTIQPLIFTLGQTAGSILTVTAPRTQIKFSGEQEIDGDLGISLDLVFEPDSGDDEIEIRFS